MGNGGTRVPVESFASRVRLKKSLTEHVSQLPRGITPTILNVFDKKKEDLMSRIQWTKVAFAGAVIALVAITGTLSHVPRVKAESEGESRSQIGLAAAPVHLNMKGKDREVVGLGSYFVNVAGDCNGCHSAGPQTEYARGGNPYFNQPEKINPATYLGGGRDFGALIPGSAHIISRNLTPDSSGLPEGGNTFAQFVQIMRTGADLDHLHPNCSGAPNATCIPAPFDGNLLQVMPWPNFKNFSDRDLWAIYQYLSAVPCVHGNYPGEAANRCAASGK
jgi:hypothetical protein